MYICTYLYTYKHIYIYIYMYIQVCSVASGLRVALSEAQHCSTSRVVLYFSSIAVFESLLGFVI